MFVKVQTQWRVASDAYIGLDYAAVRWVIQLLGVKNQLEVLSDLQVMEGRLLETLNDRKG